MRTTIVQELIRLLPAGEFVQHASAVKGNIPLNADRYLFAAGLLRDKSEMEQTVDEVREGLQVNLHSVTKAIDKILGENPKARICVVGSESAFTGSYDGIYAEAKRLLHRYVETTQLRSPAQQLVCIAPTIIRDAGMTMRRKDLNDVDRRASLHPKGRWLESIEVARLILFCLYQDDGYLTGVVIRLNGGAHTCVS